MQRVWPAFDLSLHMSYLVAGFSRCMSRCCGLLMSHGRAQCRWKAWCGLIRQLGCSLIGQLVCGLIRRQLCAFMGQLGCGLIRHLSTAAKWEIHLELGMLTEGGG